MKALSIERAEYEMKVEINGFRFPISEEQIDWPSFL